MCIRDSAAAVPADAAAVPADAAAGVEVKTEGLVGAAKDAAAQTK